MAERERRLTRPYGGVFVARSRVMNAEDIQRALRRMSHEILERNHGLDELVVIGLQTGGVDLAQALAAALGDIEGLGPDDPEVLALETTPITVKGWFQSMTSRPTGSTPAPNSFSAATWPNTITCSASSCSGNSAASSAI